MLTNDNGEIEITNLGRVSAWLYFSPYDVSAWYKNFEGYFDLPKQDDLALCWALTDIPSNNMGYIPKEIREIAEDTTWKLRNRNIICSDAVCSIVAAYQCVTGQKGEGTLAVLMRAVRYDIHRMVQAISLIDAKYAQWKKQNIWNSIATRIMYGIPESLVELVQIEGIGGATAKKLHDRGIKNLTDLANQQNLAKVQQITNPQRARAWMVAARKAIGKE